jgi:hypothetical protein
MKNKVGIRILVPRHVVLDIWRNKSCLDKERHYVIGSAREHVRRLERRGLAPVGSLEVYSCRFCGAYHVGHQIKDRTSLPNKRRRAPTADVDKWAEEPRRQGYAVKGFGWYHYRTRTTKT